MSIKHKTPRKTQIRSRTTALAVYSPRVLAAQAADGFDVLTRAQNELVLAIDQSRRAEALNATAARLRCEQGIEEDVALRAMDRADRIAKVLEQVEEVA